MLSNIEVLTVNVLTLSRNKSLFCELQLEALKRIKKTRIRPLGISNSYKMIFLEYVSIFLFFESQTPTPVKCPAFFFMIFIKILIKSY